VLGELASVPFTLRMIMVVLPQIVKQMQARREQQRHLSTVNHTYLSKQDIFELFVLYYYRNELERVLTIDEEFSKTMKEMFSFESQHIREPNNQQLNNLTNYLDFANALLSCKMLAD